LRQIRGTGINHLTTSPKNRVKGGNIVKETGGKCTCEALIKGKRIEFNAQHTGDLQEAKNYYKDAFRYVGTTRTVWCNGIKSTAKETHHIFVRNSRTDI